MSNPRRSDTATEADWSWVGEPAFERAIDRAVRKAMDRFDDMMLERDDLRQDAVLWLAVRPDLIAKARRDEDFISLAERIYINGLRQQLVPESNRQNITISRDRLLEDTED